MVHALSMNELVARLIDAGFRAVGWKGGHLRMQRGDLIIHISRNAMKVNPNYAGFILKKAGVEREVKKV